MISYLRKLSRIGVTDDLPEREVRRVVFLNILVLVITPAILLNLPLVAAYLPATRLLFVVTLINAIAVALTLVWTHRHRYLAARIWFGVVAVLFMTGETALAGAESRLHFNLLVCIFLMFYKFPPTQRVWMYLLIGAYSVSIIGCELLFRHGGVFGEMPKSFVEALSLSVTMGQVFSALLIGTFGYVTLSHAEENLAREHEVIQEKTHQLEIANKYKSHFLASASHDLRQPLHALNLFVGQLQAESDPAERHRLVARIDASVGSMNELFEALLDMTKLDVGILEANSTKFSVRKLLDRIETTFADAARNKGLHLRVVRSDARVSSDPILLERILINLVSNAVRYTARGGVLVGCRRRGEQLRIDVCDSGPGIPDSQRQRIFAEFYQLARPGPDRSGSLGLGLAIVDRLGQLLGHPIELNSRPGRGSRFSIVVPLSEARDAADDAWTLASTIADPTSGKLVVVIDDDPLVLDGMAGILRNWGCTVVTGGSDEEALSRIPAGARKPDLVISDYRLANGKTGIDAIKRLRESLGGAVPAFLITGDTAPERLREASAGGYHLLHKPVSPMALRTTLNRVFRAREKQGRMAHVE